MNRCLILVLITAMLTMLAPIEILAASYEEEYPACFAACFYDTKNYQRTGDGFVIDAVSDGEKTLVIVQLRFNTSTTNIYRLSHEIVDKFRLDNDSAVSLLSMKEGEVDDKLTVPPYVDVAFLDEDLSVEVLTSFVVDSGEEAVVVEGIVSNISITFIEVLASFESLYEPDSMQGFTEALAFEEKQ